MGEATPAVLPEPTQPIPAGDPPEKTTLYVGDLDAAVNEDDLVRALGLFGTIISTRVCRDRNSGSSLRYAYVNFNSKISAESVLQRKNHGILKGKPMRIMWTDRNPVGRKNGIGNIFVKNLDESVGGTDLELLFSPYGKVDSCKVQLDEKGRSRGFGFVQMNTEEAALSAIEALNETIPKGATKKLYVAKFLKKCERQAPHQQPPGCCNLYIKNLEKDFTDDNLQEKFSEYGKLNSVVVMKDEHGNSRGFGFVCFESPEDAKKAMDAMNGAKLGKKTIYVGPAQKKVEREEIKKKHFGQQLNKTLGTTVFVRNIEESVTDEALQEHFASCGKILWLKASRYNNGRIKGFGFVCFASIEEANRAVAMLNGMQLNGQNLNVAIAQNIENSTKLSQGQQSFTGNYPLIPQPPGYQPGRFSFPTGNHGFQYLPAPPEQIRDYSRPTNTIPFHRPACHAPFNAPMHPMTFYPPQESDYMQVRYGHDYNGYLQPPRYEKGTKKIQSAQFQQPTAGRMKKACSSIAPPNQQALLNKLELIYSNIPMLEPKQASEIASILSKPKEAAEINAKGEELRVEELRADEQVAASAAPQTTET